MIEWIDPKDEMPNDRTTPRVIEIIGTGNPIPNDEGLDRKFIGTVQQGRFVWCIFEKVDKDE